MSKVILISYPSGGFGHFIFHVLTEFAEETYKPPGNKLAFSSTGNSHGTNTYSGIYRDRQENLTIPHTDKTVLVLCDNGINNDGYAEINAKFADARIVRVTIDAAVRPIIYQTCVVKAMQATVDSQFTMANWSDADEDYAKRENYTLFYHNWPFGWQADSSLNILNFSLESLVRDPFTALIVLIQQLGMTVCHRQQLHDLCVEWQQANAVYFAVYHYWNKIEQALDSNQDLAVDHIIDLHEQGYINYCLEQKFNCTIPVYDYRDWFKTTKEMQVFKL
jgi:hypothetical protein